MGTNMYVPSASCFLLLKPDFGVEGVPADFGVFLRDFGVEGADFGVSAWMVSLAENRAWVSVNVV